MRSSRFRPRISVTDPSTARRRARWRSRIAERTPQGLLGIRHEFGSFALKEGQANDLTAVTVRFPKQWTIDPKTSLIRVVIRDRYTGHYGTLDVPVAALR